jgi:hypothetical protein
LPESLEELELAAWVSPETEPDGASTDSLVLGAGAVVPSVAPDVPLPSVDSVVLVSVVAAGAFPVVWPSLWCACAGEADSSKRARNAIAIRRKERVRRAEKRAVISSPFEIFMSAT